MPSTLRATSASAVRTLLLLAMATYGVSGYTPEYVSCYSSSQPLKEQGTDTYQSSGNCQKACLALNKPVLGLSNGNTCWCGDLLPAASDKVGNSSCDTPCQGWPDDSCGGGTDFFSIWITGLESSVGSYGGGSSSTSSSTDPESSTSTTQTPSVVTSTGPGKTVVITKPAAASASGDAAPTKDSSGGGSNTAGIAAGVVVGVVAAVSIVAGVVFFLKHRRRKAAEEEYARQHQVGDFMRGGGERKPPPTGYSTTSDSRLDPESNKRNSVGSLADDQDYSRRILRVANPDRGM